MVHDSSAQVDVSSQQWVNSVDDELDVAVFLEKCALAAQRFPKGSDERRVMLARLLAVLESSGRLSRPRLGQFKGFYDDIYTEALQRLFLHICEHIDQFDPTRGSVLSWANFLLRHRFFVEASRDYYPTVPRGVDPKSIARLSVDDLDRHQLTDEGPWRVAVMCRDIRDFLVSDPQGMFRETHVQNRPDANFRRIALQRLDGFSWQEISTELEVSIPTLSSFYQRALDKLGPMLREYLSP